jgi:hypothetical protein
VSLDTIMIPAMMGGSFRTIETARTTESSDILGEVSCKRLFSQLCSWIADF